MRRLIAFFVLLLAAYAGFEIHATASSMLAPVFVLLAPIVAFLAGAGSGPEIVFSRNPVAFLLNFPVWLAIGLGVLWLLRISVASRKKAKTQAAEDSDNAFRNTNRTSHDHRNPG